MCRQFITYGGLFNIAYTISIINCLYLRHV